MVGFPDFEIRRTDEEGLIGLSRSERSQDFAGRIGDLHFGAGFLGSIHIDQQRALCGFLEIHGHAGGTDGDDGAAFDAAAVFIVDGAVTGIGRPIDIDFAPVHVKGVVGIDAVALGVDRDLAAVDLDERGILLVVVGDVDAVVGSFDGKRPVVDEDLGGLHAFRLGRDRQFTAGDADVVIRLQAFLGGSDLQRAARDMNGILGNDAVFGGAGDLQLTFPVQHQSIAGIDHAVDGIVVRLHKSPGHRQLVFGAADGGQGHLIGVLHVDGGAARVADRNAVEDQTDTVGIAGIDDDLAVRQASGK